MAMHDRIRAAVRTDAPKVGLDDSLRTAIRSLAGWDCSALLVESGGELVGIITDMDMATSVVNGDDLDTTKVAGFMTSCELISAKPTKTPCVQLDEDESVANALAIMHEGGVHNLLVSGGGGKAIGVVSARGLLALAIA